MLDAKASDELSAPAPVASMPPALGTINHAAAGKRGLPRALIREESLKRISHTPVPFGSLSEAFAAAVFLVLFVLATTVVQQNAEPFYFSNRVRAALLDRDFAITLHGGSGALKRFDGIQDLRDVWAFLQGPFADAVYATTVPDRDDQLESLQGMMLSFNRVLGGVRLRTVRVRPSSCETLEHLPEYSSLVPFCYGSFSREHEQREGYGPVLNSADVTASLAFRFANSFFADKAATKGFGDLQTCYSDCERSCGERFGVARFRYAAQCKTDCGVHCKCIYEQPVGFSLCADPTPGGASASVPASVFAFNWTPEAAVGSTPSMGYTAVFPTSGYVVDLPLNGTAAAERLAELQEQRFVDLATRALIVEFTLYNAHLQLFNLVQLTLEFPATGGVFARCSDAVVDLFRYSTPRDTPRIVLELLVVATVLWRWKSLLLAWYRAGGLAAYVAQDPLWHALQLAHLVSFAVVIGFRLFLVDRTYGTLSGDVLAALQRARAASDAIPTFDSYAQLQRVDDVLQSVNAALVWAQFLKYTQMSKRMCLLLRVLRRAGPDLGWFLVYVLSVVCAFAQIGFLLFGARLAAFRTLGAALVTLLEALAGDLALDAMVDAHRVLGPLFYVAFYLLLLLVLLNVFLAIINDAYVQTLSEQEEEDAAEEAALVVASMREDASDGASAEMEAQLRLLARRELEQLRRYPFSKGLVPALRLLIADLKQSVYELRTGRRVLKVDPLATSMLAGVTATDARGTAHGSHAAPSRKLTQQVQKQLEKQLRVQDAVREAQRQERDAAQRAETDRQQQELAARLSTLVESNEDKTRRLDELEGTLTAIEKLCQQLVTAAAEDLPPAPKRPTTTADSARGGSRPPTALALALQRQKTATRLSGKPKTDDDGEIEVQEVSL
ncbi:hypothetical protein ATCC90586_004951 [Pythium insidiosum]|nr:hypothetical protein ATCC90586_004951 [Pythium insidiosum]